MSHAPLHDPKDDDKLSSYLSWAQVVVTALYDGSKGDAVEVALLPARGDREADAVA